MMDGVLVVRKEKGYTSHDVVAKLRGILHMKKIGHTGTLDPDAEGVLPVVLGKATKLAELLTDKEKTYETVLRLGIETDTEDMTGTVLKELPVTVSEEEVRAAASRFLGRQQQIPPMYSAVEALSARAGGRHSGTEAENRLFPGDTDPGYVSSGGEAVYILQQGNLHPYTLP